MSKAAALLNETRRSKKELISTTIRLPKEINSFVEEFAEQCFKSKQEILILLLEDGKELVRKALEETVEAPGDGRFHLLNTNKGNNDDDHEMMLRENVAAAFYGKWKCEIDRIQKDDVVFLYENGKGIVAFGSATGDTKFKDHEGSKDECHFQELRKFSIVNPPLPAGEIKRILGRNVVFLKTRSGMPDGEAILSEVMLRKEN